LFAYGAIVVRGGLRVKLKWENIAHMQNCLGSEQIKFYISHIIDVVCGLGSSCEIV